MKPSDPGLPNPSVPPQVPPALGSARASGMQSSGLQATWGILPTELCAPELNTRAIRSVVSFFRKKCGEERLQRVLNETGLPLEYLQNEHHWVSFRYFTRLLEVMTEVAGDPDFARLAGEATADKENIGIGASIVASLTNQKLMYEKLIDLMPHFNKIGRLERIGGDRRSLTCIYTPISKEYEDSAVGAEFRYGQLVAWPRISNLEKARCRVEKLERNGVMAYQYELTWNPPQTLAVPALLLICALLGLLIGLIASHFAPGMSPWLIVSGSILLASLLGLLRHYRKLVLHLRQSAADHEKSLNTVDEEVQRKLLELREANVELAQSNRALEETRDALEHANAGLTTANQELVDARAALEARNLELYLANAELEKFNAELARSNKELDAARRKAERDREREIEYARERERLLQVEAEYTNQKELEAVKSRFFARVNHELRTPMTFILPPLDALLSDPHVVLPRTYRSLLNTMRVNGLRLMKLINSLLDLSKSEVEHLYVRYEDEDLNDLVEVQVENVRPSTRLHGLELEFHPSPSLPKIHLNREKIEAALLNLLSNAVKYTPEGGRIVVSTALEGDRVRVSVADTGPGVPLELQEVIFNRFAEVNTQAARGYGNSGLGLSLVKEFVERFHNGSVRVESVPGSGATFSLALPTGTAAARLEMAERRRDKEDVPLERRREALPHGSVNEYVLNAHEINMSDFRAMDQKFELGVLNQHDARPLLLIIDDNSDILHLLSGLLHSEYNLELAGNRLEGEAKARSTRPDLILTDKMMPQAEDGLMFCRSIRAEPDLSEIPIIMLTSSADGAGIGLESGADDYLPKPFYLPELRARVKLHIERRRSFQELRRRKEELEQVQAMLVRAATVDGLTQVFNRRYLESEGRNAFALAAREQQPLGCIMLDIDHFKSFNTRYGHAGGDAVLREMGAFLNSWFGANGLVARYGGEEFCVLLPGHDLEQVRNLAEAFRVAIGSRRFDDTHQFAITASMGVSSLPECAAQSYEELLRLADDALYEAKTTRNRVAAARPDRGAAPLPAESTHPEGESSGEELRSQAG